MTEHRGLRAVAASFAIKGDYLGVEPYGTGHINDTYLVRFDQGGTEVRYIFQRINKDVFRDIPALMQNIERTTEHLQRKLLAAGADRISRRALTLVPTDRGEAYLCDDEERSWRVYVFVEEARTYDVLRSEEQAYEGARAFGRFQEMLADLPAPRLNVTIPDFHNGQARLADFRAAVRDDSHTRVAEAGPEIAFVEEHAWVFERTARLLDHDDIPTRVTHNDCKMNNVMIDDATGEGVCVIDLDTVMPGLALYDFGDMVRTSTCAAAEDTRDLSQVVMQMSRFEALARGYLSSAGEFLTDAERNELVFSGKLITLIIGTRFLTDFLRGDVYFKTHRPGHNLDRCRTQFQLVRSITEHEDEMERLVRSL